MTVRHENGRANHVIDQRSNGSRRVLLGAYPFTPAAGSVTISNAGTDGYADADAVMCVPETPVTCDGVLDAGGRLAADVSGPRDCPDCRVGLHDFAELAGQWLACNHPLDCRD